MMMPETTLIESMAVFAMCAAVVWFSGARLAYLADSLADRFKLAKSLVGLLLFVLFAGRIAEQSDLRAVFNGVTLLAAARSLPELSTSIAAVRIGAYSTPYQQNRLVSIERCQKGDHSGAIGCV